MGDWMHPDYAQRTGPKVIFCSDLTALPDGSGPDNSVWLWQEDLTGSTGGVMEQDELNTLHLQSDRHFTVCAIAQQLPLNKWFE